MKAARGAGGFILLAALATASLDLSQIDLDAESHTPQQIEMLRQVNNRVTSLLQMNEGEVKAFAQPHKDTTQDICKVICGGYKDFKPSWNGKNLMPKPPGHLQGEQRTKWTMKQNAKRAAESLVRKANAVKKMPSGAAKVTAAVSVGKLAKKIDKQRAAAYSRSEEAAKKKAKSRRKVTRRSLIKKARIVAKMKGGWRKKRAETKLISAAKELRRAGKTAKAAISGKTLAVKGASRGSTVEMESACETKKLMKLTQKTKTCIPGTHEFSDFSGPQTKKHRYLGNRRGTNAKMTEIPSWQKTGRRMCKNPGDTNCSEMLSPMFCASKECGRSVDRCKCLDGNYIHFNRYKHNTRGMTDQEAVGMKHTGLSKQGENTLHLLSTNGYHKALHVIFVQYVNYFAQYFPSICPHHVNIRKFRKQTEPSALCKGYKREEERLGETRKVSAHIWGVSPESLELGVDSALSTRNSAHFGKAWKKLKKKAKKFVKKVAKKASKVGKGLKKAAKKVGKKVKKGLKKALTKALMPAVKKIIETKVVGKLCEITDYTLGRTPSHDWTKKEFVGLLMKILKGKGNRKECTDKTSLYTTKRMLVRVIGPAFINTLIKKARASLGKLSDVDAAMCSNIAPLVSTGTKAGNKVAQLALGQDFGYSPLYHNKRIASSDKRAVLYGDAAWEFYKIQGTMQGDAGKCSTTQRFKPERIVCAGRWDTSTQVCNTCCCKQGLVRSMVNGVLLKDPNKPCDAKCENKRLCNARIRGIPVPTFAMTTERKQSPGDRQPISLKLGDRPLEGQFPECRAWFTMVDALIRFYIQLGTTITTNAFHGASRKTLCGKDGKGDKGSRYKDFCEKKIPPGWHRLPHSSCMTH